MFLGSVTVKKCLARPKNVLWSHRGSLMFMEVDSSAAIFIWGRGEGCNNHIRGCVSAQSDTLEFKDYQPPSSGINGNLRQTCRIKAVLEHQCLNVWNVTSRLILTDIVAGFEVSCCSPPLLAFFCRHKSAKEDS